MSSRPILSGTPTVEVDMARYDELLHKEATLENIEQLYNTMTNYVFHDAVGFLFKAKKAENTDE